jgi:peptidoglycan hydrolase-like protein with peptidoglycan-binding domain
MLLTFLGIYSGPIDGIPGTLTTSAITRFRQQRGLEMSMAVDPPLIAAIQSHSAFGQVRCV